MDTLKGQILALPHEKTYQVLATVNDAEAYQFAADILKFLKHNNFNVQGVTSAIFMPPVVGIQKFDAGNNLVQLKVGANK